MRSAFAPFARKIGMQKAKIFLDWPQIVGDEVAKLCNVEKVFSSTQDRQVKVYLTASPSAALTLHYMIPHMIDRMTAFFGNPICSEIIIKPNRNAQKINSFIPKMTHRSIPTNYHVEGLHEVSNENLRNALKSLSFVIDESERKNA